MKIWETSVNGPVNSSCIVLKDFIYTGDENGTFYKINILNGEIIKKINLNAGIVATPLVIKNKSKFYIVIPLLNGNVITLNPKDFTKIWEYKTKFQDPIVASPVKYDINQDNIDDIILTSRNGYLYIINGVNGKNLVEPVFAKNSIASSPILGDVNSDGFLDVIFGCENGYLYVYTIKTVPDKIIDKNQIICSSFIDRFYENNY